MVDAPGFSHGEDVHSLPLRIRLVWRAISRIAPQERRVRRTHWPFLGSVLVPPDSDRDLLGPDLPLNQITSRVYCKFQP